MIRWYNVTKLFIPVIIGAVLTYYHYDICHPTSYMVTVVSGVFSILTGFLMSSLNSLEFEKEHEIPDNLEPSEIYNIVLEYNSNLSPKILLLYAYLGVIGMSLANVWLKEEIIKIFHIQEIYFFCIVVSFCWSLVIPISIFNTRMNKKKKKYEEAREKENDFKRSGL